VSVVFLIILKIKFLVGSDGYPTMLMLQYLPYLL